MSKKIGKNYMDPSETLSRRMPSFIVQNEAVIVVVELFKQGKFFGTPGMIRLVPFRVLFPCVL